MAKTNASSGADGSPPRRKGGKLKMLLGALVLMGAGVGGAVGAMQLGLIGAAPGPTQPDTPRLLSKGQDDPYALDPEAEDPASFVDGEGGSEYRTSYYSFEESFTANLKDSAGLVQVSLAASTRHDGRVLQWLKRHELAVRSAILVELADTREDDAYSVEGKARLQERLAQAINAVLEEKEGFGGIDQVHFRTYLVQ